MDRIKQISNFLSAYPKDVVEAGIEAWRTGEMPVKEDSIEGMVSNVPLAQNYNELTEEAGIHRIQNAGFRIPRLRTSRAGKCGMTEKRRRF